MDDFRFSKKVALKVIKADVECLLKFIVGFYFFGQITPCKAPVCAHLLLNLRYRQRAEVHFYDVDQRQKALPAIIKFKIIERQCVALVLQ